MQFDDFVNLIALNEITPLLKDGVHPIYSSTIATTTNLDSLVKLYKKSCLGLAGSECVPTPTHLNSTNAVSLLDTFIYVQDDLWVRRAFFEQADKLYGALARKYYNVAKRVNPLDVINHFVEMINHAHYKDRHYISDVTELFKRTDDVSFYCIADMTFKGFASYCISHIERQQETERTHKLLETLGSKLPFPTLTHMIASTRLTTGQVKSLLTGCFLKDGFHNNELVRTDMYGLVAELIATCLKCYPELSRHYNDDLTQSLFVNIRNKEYNEVINVMTDRYIAVWMSELVEEVIVDAQKQNSGMAENPDMSFLVGRQF